MCFRRDLAQIAWSPNGAILAFGLDNGEVELYSAATYTKFKTAQFAAPIHFLACDDGGTEAIVVDHSFKVLKWNPVSGARVEAAELPATTERIALGSGGNVIGYDDGHDICLRDLSNNREVWRHGHPEAIWDICIDGDLLFTGCHDGRLRAFDIKTGQLMAEAAQRSIVLKIDVDSRTHRVITTSNDNIVRIFDRDSCASCNGCRDRCIPTRQCRSVTDLAFSR